MIIIIEIKKERKKERKKEGGKVLKQNSGEYSGNKSTNFYSAT